MTNLKANFLIIDMLATFDGILGRPLIHTINKFPSSFHQLMFFKTPNGAGMIHGDQTVGRELMRIKYDCLTTKMPPQPKKYNSK